MLQLATSRVAPCFLFGSKRARGYKSGVVYAQRLAMYSKRGIAPCLLIGSKRARGYGSGVVYATTCGHVPTRTQWAYAPEIFSQLTSEFRPPRIRLCLTLCISVLYNCSNCNQYCYYCCPSLRVLNCFSIRTFRLFIRLFFVFHALLLYYVYYDWWPPTCVYWRPTGYSRLHRQLIALCTNRNRPIGF